MNRLLASMFGVLLFGGVSAPRVVRPADRPPSRCRALVNLDATAAAPAAAGEVARDYRTVELDLTTGVTARDQPGLTVKTVEGLFSLNVVPRKQGSATWEELTLSPWSGGPTRLLLNPHTADSVADEAGGAPSGYFDQTRVQVTSIIGPYVSLYLPNEGYAGGAHPYDGSTHLTVRAPDGARIQWLQLLGEDVSRELNRAIGRDEAARAKRLGINPRDDALPRFDGKDSDPALALGLAAQGLELRSILSCCTWAENHNHHSLAAPLSRVPDLLSPHLRLEAGRPGFLVAPDGCAAIGIQGGRLMVQRKGARAPVPAPWASNHDLTLLGVIWQTGPAPKGVQAAAPSGERQGPQRSLPAAPPAAAVKAPSSPAEVRPLLDQAAALHRKGKHREAIALCEQAIQIEPGNVDAWTDLGWIRMLSGDLEVSKEASKRALDLAQSDEKRGSILYNLGRAAEASGEPGVAIEYYRESVAVRPNSSVQKRLNALLPR